MDNSEDTGNIVRTRTKMKTNKTPHTTETKTKSNTDHTRN